jgi:outer membrane protein TolC
MRFNMVKESYILGDFPAIDTVEAYTQIMDRIYRFQNAQIDFFRSTQFINTFLWDENVEEVELANGVFPENVLDEILFDYNKESLREYIVLHPELQLKDFDIASTEVERRLKSQMLLPVLKVNYNFLTESIGDMGLSPFLENNYKAGLTFGMPLFLRRERGNLGFTKAKLEFKNYERDLKFVQLKTKLESEIYNFETVDRQLRVFFNNVNGLQRLLDGEMMRFEIGESSLFLVNAREVSLFNAQVTLNQLAAKRKTAYAKMLNAAGLGFDEL